MLKTLKGTKWIVACSGGPDSMALLDMARSHNLILSVAHVNYQRRPTADRDEQIVRNYCSQYAIPLYVLYPEYAKGNFQSWARDVRYDFFLNLCQQEKAQGVLVAHQKEDVLETYLMQKERGSFPSCWGIAEESFWKEMKIVRPLLKYHKEELTAYCKSNQIAYGIDESNLKNDYTRNRIRHEVIDKMTDFEKEQLFAEIFLKNQETQILLLNIQQKLSKKMNTADLIKADNPELLLNEWIAKHARKRISFVWTQELLKQLSSNRNLEIPLGKCVKLSKMGNLVEIVEQTEVSYSYVLDKIEMLKTEYFEIAFEGKGTEALTLTEDDFPITVRNAQPGDAIEMRFGRKKLSRWFIDRKIPHNQRKIWPVVVNRHNEIILVPQIGCDVKHYSNNPTCFVIK